MRSTQHSPAARRLSEQSDHDTVEDLALGGGITLAWVLREILPRLVGRWNGRSDEPTPTEQLCDIMRDHNKAHEKTHGLLREGFGDLGEKLIRIETRLER